MRRSLRPGSPGSLRAVLALTALAALFFMHGMTSMHQVLAPFSSSTASGQAPSPAAASASSGDRIAVPGSIQTGVSAAVHHADHGPAHGGHHLAASCLGVVEALLLVLLVAVASGDQACRFRWLTGTIVCGVRSLEPRALSPSRSQLGVART